MFLELFITLVTSQTTPPVPSAPTTATAASTQVLRVGTTERIPYSWKMSDGTWGGPAVQLWQKIATDNRLRYEITGYTWDELTAKIRDGSIDVAATGIQITTQQDLALDFTLPFDAGGYSLVTHSHSVTLPRAVMKRVLTFDVLIWLIFMLIATVVAGSIIRLVERKHNHEHFAHQDSFINGLWWAISTLSTSGYGDVVPRSRVGKLIGAIWMLISIFLVAIFSATIVATLTVGQLTPYFTTIRDMKANLIGIADRPSSRVVATQLGILPRVYGHPGDGLDALSRGEIEGFLHPTNELRALVARRNSRDFLIMPREVIRGFVSLGLSEHLDPLTVRQINAALIKIVESPEWNAIAQAMDDPSATNDSP